MALVATGTAATKVCAACKHPKPWSEFDPKTKWPDGTMRRPRSRCKTCIREYQRNYQRQWGNGFVATTGRGGKHAPGRCPKMPVGPFSAWLRTLGDSHNDIARATGMHPDRVRQILAGRTETVLLDVVDMACIHAGANLNDLYPLPDGNPLDQAA